MRIAVFYLVCMLLLPLLAGRAVAGPAEDEARKHTKAGTAAFNLGHYDEAVVEYEAAYKAVPDAALLFNVGQAHRLGGNVEKAKIAYRSYLRTSPADASNRELAEKHLEQLEAATWAPGPAPNLEPSPVRQAQELAPPSAPPAPAMSPSALELRAASQPASPDEGWLLDRKWTWVAGGTTVVLAGGAIAAGLAMQSKFDNLKKSCGKAAGANWTGCTSGEINSLDTRKNTANVLWGLTAAAAVTTGILFWVEGRKVTVAPMAGMATGLLAEVEY